MTKDHPARELTEAAQGTKAASWQRPCDYAEACERTVIRRADGVNPLLVDCKLLAALAAALRAGRERVEGFPAIRVLVIELPDTEQDGKEKP